MEDTKVQITKINKVIDAFLKPPLKAFKDLSSGDPKGASKGSSESYQILIRVL